MILVRDIQRATAEHYGLPVEEMRSPRRTPKVSHPRQMAMYVSASLTTKSSVRIGQLFNRDHSTVIMGVRAAERRCAEDAKTSDAARQVVRRVLLEEAGQ